MSVFCMCILPNVLLLVVSEFDKLSECFPDPSYFLKLQLFSITSRLNGTSTLRGAVINLNVTP